jgi:hypothetical protein
MVCVLLVSVAAIAQAAHIHGQLLPNHATQVGAHIDGNEGVSEDACPLCVAMHSALPTAGFAALPPDPAQESTLPSACSRKPQSPWTFAAFSRPPPSFKRA